MPPALTDLIQQVSRLVSPALFHIPDSEAVLERRDLPEFESDWMRVFHTLSESEKRAALPAEVSEAIRTLEEEAFKAVYAATLSNDFTEFAPLVSDDFSLFGHAIAQEFHDPWLGGLLSCYQQGQFPTGFISCVDVPLQELLKRGA